MSNLHTLKKIHNKEIPNSRLEENTLSFQYNQLWKCIHWNRQPIQGHTCNNIIYAFALSTPYPVVVYLLLWLKVSPAAFLPYLKAKTAFFSCTKIPLQSPKRVTLPQSHRVGISWRQVQVSCSPPHTHSQELESPQLQEREGLNFSHGICTGCSYRSPGLSSDGGYISLTKWLGVSESSGDTKRYQLQNRYFLCLPQPAHTVRLPASLQFLDIGEERGGRELSKAWR